MLKHSDALAEVDPVANLPGYWTLQIVGWSAFALLSIFSLNIWYNPGELAPALHSGVQSVIGVFVSHPLRWLARRTWNTRPSVRIAVNGIGILIAAQVWTVLRLLAFTWMTNLPIGPEDWGGWIFGSLTVFLSWSLCYHALKYYRQWLEQRDLSAIAQKAALEAEAHAQSESIKRLKAESLMRESQIRMLNYQLNPHFFFNALNSVSALVKRDDKDAAVEMIARIGDFLRVALETEQTPLHPLRDEIDIANLYLDIEKVRFGDRLVAQFNVSEAANAVDVPNLLLQPLVENCIKHGVSRSLTPTMISLSAMIAEGKLRIRIEDDGPGCAIDQRRNSAGISRGIGLKNVEDRLRSIYGEAYDLTVDTGEAQGFRIEISLPARSAGENHHGGMSLDLVAHREQE